MLRRLFTTGETPADNRAVILWWELRRVPYNLLVGIAGIVSIIALEMLGSVLLPRGADAEEPLALLLGIVLYAAACNVAYTFGWIGEIYFFSHAREAGLVFRKKAFPVGLVLSCLVPLGLLFLCAVAWTFFTGN